MMLFGFAGLEYYWFHTLIHFLQIQELDISRNHISDLAGLRGLSNLTVSIHVFSSLLTLYDKLSDLGAAFVNSC